MVTFGAQIVLGVAFPYSLTELGTCGYTCTRVPAVPALFSAGPTDTGATPPASPWLTGSLPFILYKGLSFWPLVLLCNTQQSDAGYCGQPKSPRQRPLTPLLPWPPYGG